MRVKTDDLSNDWLSDYSYFSLLNVPIKETIRLCWTMDDENLESCLFTYGCLVGQSVGSYEAF